MRSNPLLSVLLGGLLLHATACSSLRPPTETLSAAELSIRKADESHASTHAPLDLVKAREKFEQAKLASADGDYKSAQRLAEQALVDARLAEERARTAEAKEDAHQMRRSVEALQGETERYSPKAH